MEPAAFGRHELLLMHVIKALSDCSFPAELRVSLKAGAFQEPPAFRAINNRADGDKGWSMESSDNARLIHNLNLIISFSLGEGRRPSPPSPWQWSFKGGFWRPLLRTNPRGFLVNCFQKLLLLSPGPVSPAALGHLEGEGIKGGQRTFGAVKCSSGIP